MLLGIGRTVSLSQKKNIFTPLPPVYILRDENLFWLNLHDRRTNKVKVHDVEVDTSISDDAAAEVLQGGYRAKRHEPLFQYLTNIMAKRFKGNVDRRLVQYIVEAYGPSRGVWQKDIRKEG